MQGSNALQQLVGVVQYECSKSVSKDLWVQQQYELVWAANQQALRSIQHSMQKSAGRLSKKSLEILEGNLVLLWDHPEGHNKIQDKYRSEKFVVVGKHPEPNGYCIKPVNGNGPEQMVNWCQLQDLGETQSDGGFTSPQNDHDGVQVPSFNPKLINTKSPPILHPYATHSKGRPPVHSLSITAGVGSSGLRPAQPQRVTFCSGVLANLSGFRTMPESAGPGVVHFLPFSILWATSGTGNIILFLSFFFPKSIPAVGGPRLYGARQVGLGFITLRLQWPVWPVNVTREIT